jgi:phenylalanyl-tRNA synthetase beta chain
MKIAISNLKELLDDDISIKDISKKLFQLGHENEIINDILDIEITPNRGDCMSVLGIARELKNFYPSSLNFSIYEDEIESLDLGFSNKACSECNKISFLLIEVEKVPSRYKKYLEDYFDSLSVNKNNFFADISNYISYELGQPTHCYDYEKISHNFDLERIERSYEFETLTGKKITLSGSNLVFKSNDEIINLAGIMGGENTACSKDTKSTLIESAYFNPESIIGKSTKYDLNSESAYKFERGVDRNMIDTALRRFIQIVSEHTQIKNVKIYKEISEDISCKKIILDLKKIEKILGIHLDEKTSMTYLENLGFEMVDNSLIAPSYRHDIYHNNDIAEEIARVIGYDNFDKKKINIPSEPKTYFENNDLKLKSFLAKKGFLESINYPFTKNKESFSVIVDNPLDTKKKFFRTDLKHSLIENLLYNERRQKDSIKIFEISDIYKIDADGNSISKEKKLGLIISGRKGKNAKDYSSVLKEDFIVSIFRELGFKNKIDVQNISRENLNSKSKQPIFYFEIDFSSLESSLSNQDEVYSSNFHNLKFSPISDFPSISRDLSFLIKDSSKIEYLVDFIKNYKDDLLKETFIFDQYNNEEKNIIKLGFKFIFQSNERTLTDKEIDKVINDIVKFILFIGEIEVPGFKLKNEN